MPEPAALVSRPTLLNRLHRCICLECLAGPPELEREPFGKVPASPLFPVSSERVLRLFDWLITACAGCRPGLDTGYDTSVAADGSTTDAVGRGDADVLAEEAVSCRSSSGSLRRGRLRGDPGLTGPGTVLDTERRCRMWLQASLVVASALALTLGYYAQNFAATTDLGKPLELNCNMYITKYAVDFGFSKCGLEAAECGWPTAWVPLRCAGYCALRQVHPLAVPVVGSGPYRSDSRICTAAAHVGLVGPGGGCVDYRFGGPAHAFNGSTNNGVKSFSFDSWYPLTLEMRASSGARFCGYGAWWALLVLNVALLFLVSLLRPPRRLLFWLIVTTLYWYAALASSVGRVSIRGVFEKMGSFAFLSLAVEVFLWKLGGARFFFPDTAKGAPFDVLFLEVLPALPLLHMQLIALFVGDYDINGSLFKDWRPLVLYGVGLIVLLPAICVLLRQWYRAGSLRWLVCLCLDGIIVMAVLSIIFATVDWGLHLHHYFISLMGYLGARGKSRTAAIVRAFCLGAFIDGLCRWGMPANIPLWSEGSGWLPNTGSVDSASEADASNLTVLWTAVERTGGHGVFLSWALLRDLQQSCDDPPEATGRSAPVYIVEMNHVEAYRGHATHWNFSLPPQEAAPDGNTTRRFFFRVGLLDLGSSIRVTSASRVLEVLVATPPVRVYYTESMNACQRAAVLNSQPDSSLIGFI